MAIRCCLSDPRGQRAFNLLMAGTLLVLAIMFLRRAQPIGFRHTLASQFCCSNGAFVGR